MQGPAKRRPAGTCRVPSISYPRIDRLHPELQSAAVTDWVGLRFMSGKA
jgi:hypothetical protein